MNKLIFLIISLPLLASCNSSNSGAFSEDDVEYVDRNEGVQREEGFVPDERTAVAIAEAVWLRIYGREVLDRKPFVARLVDDERWYVKGSLLEGADGGVPYLVIRKRDGMILKVLHSA